MPATLAMEVEEEEEEEGEVVVALEHKAHAVAAEIVLMMRLFALSGDIASVPPIR